MASAVRKSKKNHATKKASDDLLPSYVLGLMSSAQLFNVYELSLELFSHIILIDTQYIPPGVAKQCH